MHSKAFYAYKVGLAYIERFVWLASNKRIKVLGIENSFLY